jgi:5-methylthioadenosine/S-adenosylhomocysteine deaminase
MVRFASAIAAACVALLAVHAARADTFALRGTVLTPDAVIEDATVVIDGEAIGQLASSVTLPVGASVVATDGLILPGLIDLHNHLTWNVFPRWKPNQLFADRYEWQALPEYDRFLRIPQGRMLADGYGCKANLFAEIKAIIGGATSVSGSFIGRSAGDRMCVVGMARNLDHESGLLRKPSTPPCAGAPPPMISAVANEVFPMEIPHDRLDWYRCELHQGTLRSLLVHLSEGRPSDASSRREFRMLKAQGMLQPGLVLIHGTALTATDLKEVKDSNVGLIWSPRSNNELYGGTLSIAIVQAVGVPVAIAPDWSPTGSAGMLQEMSYIAARYSEVTPKSLVSMATSVPAAIARIDGQVGSLQTGRLADLLVLKKRIGGAYETVIASTPADVRLIVVGGTPVYGDRDLMERLLPGKPLDELTVCGTQKVLNLGGVNLPGIPTWDGLRRELEAELQRYGSALAAMECN